MLRTILTRRSVRRFTTDPVTDAELRDLLRAAMQAPSAVDERAWQFVILSGDVLASYLDLNGNTPRGAPTGILVCCDPGLEKVAGYAVQDCSAAVMNILLAAHAKGLGAVWTTVFEDHRPAVRALLGIPEAVVPFAFVPIGRPAARPEPADRYDEGRVHRNGW
jgi:nitroreductase